MSRLNIHDARCEALFASGLPQSDALIADAVTEAITGTVRRLGCRGCAACMAQEFGDHPETAVARMRWVRRVVDEVFSPDRPRPGVLAQWRPLGVLQPVGRTSGGVIAHAA